MKSRKFWSCKDPNEIVELTILHPYSFLMFADIARFCYDSGYPAPILTRIASTEEENESIGAETDVHVRLGGFDLRSSIYTKDQISNICTFVNTNYLKYAAMNSQGQVRGMIFHKIPGNVDHLHAQIAKRYALPYFTGEIE